MSRYVKNSIAGARPWRFERVFAFGAVLAPPVVYSLIDGALNSRFARFMGQKLLGDSSARAPSAAE